MAVTDLGLAVNDRVKRGNEWVDETTFVDVTLWGRTAEIAGEYLSKGAPVLIEGRLKLDTWEGQDGKRNSKLRVVGERMQMLGRREGGSSGGGGGARPARSGQRSSTSAYPAEPDFPDESYDSGESRRGYDAPPSGGMGDDIPF